MLLKCQCCGIEREFNDGEEAFQAGWDAPPRFTGYVTCDLCPAVCIVMGASHEKAHELWAKEGRPKEFTVLKCGTDQNFGDPTADQKLAEQKPAIIAALQPVIRRMTEGKTKH